MDYLWTPWRYRYVTTAGVADACIFCNAAAGADDRASLIVHRARHCYAILNRFPYTSGHVMVTPYAHVATLEEMEEAAAVEMALLVRRAEALLRRLYRPEGMNVGINIGRVAGAGVAGHIHTHVLPRWTGDTSFMSAVAETRVLPEDLTDTWDRLTREWGEA